MVDTIFAVVNLIGSQKNIVIPIKWIESFNTTSMANDGINQSMIHKIFYSKNQSEMADFKLPTNPLYFNERGCYLARAHKLFGEKTILQSQLISSYKLFNKFNGFRFI